MTDITAEQQETYHVLVIWARDDRDREPTTSLISKTIPQLHDKLRKYLNDHRDEEDYMDDEEWAEYMKEDIFKILDANLTWPELNCMYKTCLMTGH